MHIKYIHKYYIYSMLICCTNRHKVRAARVKLHGQRAMATTKCVWTGLKSKHATRPKHMPIRRSRKAVRGKVKHKLQSRKERWRGGTRTNGRNGDWDQRQQHTQMGMNENKLISDSLKKQCQLRRVGGGRCSKAGPRARAGSGGKKYVACDDSDKQINNVTQPTNKQTNGQTNKLTLFCVRVREREWCGGGGIN